MTSFSISMLLLLWLATPCAAEERMINLPPASAGEALRLAPGTQLRLPDGSLTVIREALPDGTFITREGLIILSDGRISQDEGAEMARIAESAGQSPDGSAEGPQQKEAGNAPEKKPEKPDATANEQEEKPEQRGPATVQETKSAPEAAIPRPAASVDDGQITIAGLLPMTPITPADKSEVHAQKTPPRQARQASPDERAQPGNKAAKPEKQSPAKAQEKAGGGKSRARPGEHLRIPPEATASGSLDFLEGCWQGTRPEYYSKRSIRECFCFDGKGSGKRRIIDPAAGGRMCIGPARASLTGSGVLSVTSGRSPCTDGERWGQAEMVCRGEGSRTPCSWVFRDAKGGRQSYEIPLVRVESCGR